MDGSSRGTRPSTPKTLSGGHWTRCMCASGASSTQKIWSRTWAMGYAYSWSDSGRKARLTKAQNICVKQDMSEILGEAIYQKDDFSIHEVDGEEHKVSTVPHGNPPRTLTNNTRSSTPRTSPSLPNSSSTPNRSSTMSQHSSTTCFYTAIPQSPIANHKSWASSARRS